MKANSKNCRTCQCAWHRPRSSGTDNSPDFAFPENYPQDHCRGSKLITGTVSPEFPGFLGGTGKGFLSTVTSNSGRLRAFLLLARFHVRRGKGLRQKMTSIATSTCRLLQLTFAICNLPKLMYVKCNNRYYRHFTPSQVV